MELSDLLSNELLAVCDTSSPEVDIDALFATVFQELKQRLSMQIRAPPPRIALLQNGSRCRKLRLISSKHKLKGSLRRHTILHKSMGRVVQLPPKELPGYYSSSAIHTGGQFAALACSFCP